MALNLAQAGRTHYTGTLKLKKKPKGYAERTMTHMILASCQGKPNILKLNTKEAQKRQRRVMLMDSEGIVFVICIVFVAWLLSKL